MFDEATKEQIAEAAKKLQIAPAALMAVADVESGGRVFAKVRGKQEPIIRFEGHCFYRFLKDEKRQLARDAGLADPRPGAVKNPRGQAGRWNFLNRAIKINRTAALSSTAWGLGNVMGAHWQWLGYGSVDALVYEARSGVPGQLALFARYLKKSDLVAPLQEQDWESFTRRYKGADALKAGYDHSLLAAFQKYASGEDAAILPKPVFSRSQFQTLMFGARGIKVQQLQKAMARLGYSLVEDGFYGLVTDRVVRQFQGDHHLQVNGIIGTKEHRLILGWYDQLMIKTGCTFKNVLSQARKKPAGVWLRLKTTIQILSGKLRNRLLSIFERIA